MLLDPATGREIETNFPGSRFMIMEPVSRHYVHYTLYTYKTFAFYKSNFQSPGVNQNGIMSVLSQGARRRSDYISPSGTPLYKLRQRNPFGFGG